ncbi:amino acid ABC transporter permease [Bosea sp. NBC_00550]|uniref:amino acid ABC transporter permease n=1 Tax=Bosea sp. NBC_00550 TaxID=2969621 RepID=UPI00222EDC78|nr:amino acid ABC transporter permease [Bosea sp. NBC_00550]UZF91817.1 amino acid ABC transporter permease [Bosea sp. NBC_00550]
MKYGLQFRDVFAAWESILDGVWITLLLSAAAMIGGLVIGIACAAARVYGPAWLRRAVGTYVEVIRNTPLLVQLFLIFFGLPSFGLRLDGFTAAIIALIVNLGAYTTEIVRAGLEAIPKAQVEAGHSLGLSGLQVFRYVVMFPALKAMFPALASQFVLLMLATSVVSQISVEDLFHAASIVQSRTFRDFEVYTVIGVLYLGLAFAFRGLFAGIYYWAFVRR